MKVTKAKAIVLMGALAMTTAAIAAPSVEITNVQQQYPWTNTVDITYTVAGVKDFPAKTATGGYASNETFFVAFTAKSGNTVIKDVNGNTVFTNGLVNGSSANQVAQWHPALGQQLTNCTITPSVFRGEDDAYMIVDLEKWTVYYEPMSSQEASNARYNTDEYKTRKLVLRRIPAGTYNIGYNEVYSTMYGYSGNTAPDTRHKVTIPADYYAAIFDFTEAQWRRVMEDSTKETKLPKTSLGLGTIRGRASPSVVPLTGIFGVLNEKLSTNGFAQATFDLPTETMYEVAARARCETRYLCGDTPERLTDYVWNGINEGWRHEVGLKKPNNWGLYDVNGNVWEFTRDASRPVGSDLAKYTRQAANGFQPIDAVDGASTQRAVLRSGGYECRNSGGYLNVSWLTWTLNTTGAHVGFRVYWYPAAYYPNGGQK